MEISSEDALRLNVLLANAPRAIRIHESSMTLYGLLESGESSVRLNPSCGDEQYLKLIRAFLSDRALGSPGGYPFYLQRWTRMGRMREDSLERLLLLGDPAAVFAVVCAEGLTSELARRAWWAAEEAENARRMLQTREVVQSDTGPMLARYLIEYLPFESESETMVESVRMALQPGLLEEDERLALWNKASRKIAYLVGFIAADPDDLPEQLPPRNDFSLHQDRLGGMRAGGNALSALMLKLLSGPGQTYISTCRRILGKPTTQDVVTTTLEVLCTYCSAARPDGDCASSIDQLLTEADDFLGSAEAGMILAQDQELAEELKAVRILSGLGQEVMRSLLGDSSAIGSLMRRKLEPLLTQATRQFDILFGHQA